jgi:RNA polymerase sigma-70 factor (ECF subfamily)
MGAKPTDTADLLKSWHHGKEASLRDLLSRNLEWIYERVRQRLGDRLRLRLESCDIVQDAAVQFLQYGPRILVSDEKKFRALLARIVENVLRDKNDWFTARRRAISLEQPLPEDTILYLDPGEGQPKTPSMSAQRHEEEAWLRLGMELLDPEDRELLVLRQWDHLSFEEIGERLKITGDAAWMRHKRAVDHLAKKVGDLRRGRLAFLEEENSS